MSDKVYLAGDIMTIGSQHEMKQIEDICTKLNLEFYSARLNNEINDKKNQSKASNDKLAEKILEADTKRIHESNIFIINYQPHALGTIVEIGQILELYLRDPTIKVYAVYHDIRRTDIPECGDRRSWGVNQYVYGAILKMTNGRGFISLNELDMALASNRAKME